MKRNETQTFLVFGMSRERKYFPEENENRGEMISSTPQEIYFLSHFSAFIIKYSDYFLNVAKHLKWKLKKILISHIYKKKKKLIS